MTVYDKDEALDLSPRVKKALKGALENELRVRRVGEFARGKKPRRSP